MNRKGVVLGVVAVGVVAALASGAGVALAATGAARTGSTGSCTDQDGHRGAMFGMSVGQGTPITAAAGYLGLSESDLRAQLRAAKSLAEVATAQGKSVSGLEDAIIAAVKAHLDSNTTLTADQKATMLAQAKEHIDEMVNTTHAAGSGFGPMGHGMSGMWR